MYLGPYIAGHLEQMWVSTNQPKWTNYEFFQQFHVQNKNSEGLFYGKN